jgi:hypothetical protein
MQLDRGNKKKETPPVRVFVALRGALGLSVPPSATLQVTE